MYPWPPPTTAQQDDGLLSLWRFKEVVRQELLNDIAIAKFSTIGEFITSFAMHDKLCAMIHNMYHWTHGGQAYQDACGILEEVEWTYIMQGLHKSVEWHTLLCKLDLSSTTLPTTNEIGVDPIHLILLYKPTLQCMLS